MYVLVKILFISLAETANWWLVSQVYPANMFYLANTKIRFRNASMALLHVKNTRSELNSAGHAVIPTLSKPKQEVTIV